mgnify:CR=1 FL=1
MKACSFCGAPADGSRVLIESILDGVSARVCPACIAAFRHILQHGLGVLGEDSKDAPPKESA